MNNAFEENLNELDRLTHTVPEAAIRLRVGKNTLYDAIKRGEVPSVRIGRRLLVPVQALEAMLASQQ